MAFQNMLEGDCGAQNPLMKLGGHFSQDQAFRQDRPHTLPPQFADSECLVNEFLEDQFSQNLQSFRMDTLAEELRDIDRFARNPLNQAPNVAQLAPRETDALWSDEFLRAEKQISQSFEPSDIAGAVLNYESAAPGEEAAGWFERAVTNPRSSEKDFTWTDEFNSPDWNLKWKTGDSAETKTEPESKFQRFWQRADDNKNDAAWVKEFEEAEAAPDSKQSDWASELTSAKSEKSVWLEGYGTDDVEAVNKDWDDHGDEFWKSMQTMWKQLADPAGGNEWADEFGVHVDPFTTYSFDETNPMKDLPNPLEEGLQKLAEQDVPSAVLCFEAAAQANPEDVLAWKLLGTSQAKNEQDPFAIAALKKCLSLEPGNLEAMMSLAISYTNENYQNSACHMLRDWLANNPKYQDIPVPPLNQSNFLSSMLDRDFHENVKNYFLAAANLNPVGDIDQDVQCALGVLFNLSYEHDKAVDCFKAALQAAPKDYEMWNRLGATLANGNRSEEAVDAYYNALQLCPGFIRARYNLGITCINLKANKEAAEHLLSALNQQAKGSTSRGDKGGMSDSIWNTLRLVVGLLGYGELLPAVENRDLATLNQAFKAK